MSNICCHRHRHPVAIPATRGNAAFLYCLLQQPAHPARLPEHRLMPPTHATQRSMERETGIEPAQSAWKAEVLPLNYSRPDGTEQRNLCWWREVDSNHRRRKPADLQSAPVGRLGIPPQQSRLFSYVENALSTQFFVKIAPAAQLTRWRPTGRRRPAPSGKALPAAHHPPGQGSPASCGSAQTLKRKCRTSPSWTT